MNCRYIKILLVLACVAALFSCSKEWKPDEGARVAVMTLSPSDNGAATRSSINETAGTGKRKVTWSVADEIYWWTSPTVSGTPGDKRKYTVLADAEAVEIPVSYNDNDQYVTFYTAGGSVGGGTTSDMTQLTFSVDQHQDGTFASNHVAVHKSKLILEASAASMKPVATMLRFTLSTLTYAGKTVNNIRIGCMDGTSRLWGDFKVTMDNSSLGSVSSVDKTADAVADASPVIIDKRASAFQTGVPYYVAIRPNTVAWPQGIYFDLYNGEAKLGRVIVRDSAAGDLTLAHGKIRDLGDLKTHVSIPVSESQLTIYPPYAAFHKDMTKKFWLRVDSQGFNGNVTWSKSGSNADKFVLTPGNRETVNIDGESVSCWTATLSPTTDVKDYNRYICTLKAEVSGTGIPSVSTTVEVEMGKFVDFGCVNKENKRVLWCMGGISDSAYDERHWYTSNERSGYNTLKIVHTSQTTGRFPWGFVSSTRNRTGWVYGRWNGGTATADKTGGKYTSVLNTLDEKDDAAFRCMENYSGQGETNWRMPTGEEAKILIESVTVSVQGNYKRLQGKNFGYTDCWVEWFNADSGGNPHRLWTRSGIMSGTGKGIYLALSGVSNTAIPIFQGDRNQEFEIAVVKYVGI